MSSKMYRARIVAHHDFGNVRYESFHLSLDGARNACEVAMTALKAKEDAEWHCYLDQTVTPMTLES